MFIRLSYLHLYNVLRKTVLSFLRTSVQVFVVCLIIYTTIIQIADVKAQEVLFDFDNAPLYTSLPINLTVSGITAHLSATAQGYSIQNANVLGFTPPGFSGRIIYPNSIYLSDLRVRFDQTLTSFSIMYSCQELGCDDAATMRVTVYKNGIFIGTNTKTASNPGTWPVDTLRCSFSQGFDSVIVHYNNPPTTCQDYGVIYMADNMRVTPIASNVSENIVPAILSLIQNYPNPFNPSTIIGYQLRFKSFVTLKVFDVLGKEVATLVNNVELPGEKSVIFNADNLESGVYFYRLEADNFIATRKFILLR